jgi:outer membrane protein insertion porin family
MILGTSGRRTIPRILEVFATASLILLSVQALESQQPHENEGTQYFIERIDIEGFRRIQNATMRAHILSRPGDPYNSEVVQRDAQALRDTGYFDEVRIRIEDSPDRPNGKIVVFRVIERPIIRRTEYRGIKSITEADILKGLKDNEITLSMGSQFDQTMLTRAATVIEGLLSAHGRRSATVKSTYDRIATSNAVSIVFNIDEGPKAQSAKNLP